MEEEKKNKSSRTHQNLIFYILNIVKKILMR
jgi:hypothetical protein